jgi:hypothetical protein
MGISFQRVVATLPFNFQVFCGNVGAKLSIEVNLWVGDGMPREEIDGWKP